MSTQPQSLPPLPPGFESYKPVGTQAQGGLPPLPSGYENYHSPDQAPQSWLQKAWEGFGKNVLPEGHPLADFANRVMSGVKGTAETLLKPPQGPTELGATALLGPVGPAATRFAKGQAAAETQLAPQLAQQTEAAAAAHAHDPLGGHLLVPNIEDARAVTTGASMLNPFASASVANVNTLQDQGQSGKSISEGLADSLMLGAGLIKLPEGPVKPVSTLKAATEPAHIEALTGFLKTTKTDPHVTATTALPEARAVAAREGVDPSTFQGRKGGEAVVGKGGVFDKAIQEHRAEYAALRKPVLNEPMDTTPIAQAYLDKITPEMRANDPQAVNRLTAEAKKFADVNDKGEVIGVKPQPLSQLDDFRVRLNNELDKYEQAPLDRQLRSDIEVKADKAAVDAARELVYNTISRKTGTSIEAIRDLQRRQGALIESRRDLTQAFHDASGQQGERVAGSISSNPPGSGRFATTVGEKATHLYPTKRGVERLAAREVGPKPLSLFNRNLKLMFDKLEPEPISPGGGVTAPAPPTPPPSSKVGGAKVLAGDVPLSGPVSPAAADITRLKAELKAATDPKEIADIQQALEHAQARLENRPYTPPQQAEVEPLPVPNYGAGHYQPPAYSREGGAAPPRQIQTPRNPAAMAPSPRSQSLQGPERAAAITAVMSQLKNGEITQAEADKQIQRLNGGGGRKLIRMPQPPSEAGQHLAQPDYGDVKPVVPGNIQWYGRPKVAAPKGMKTPEGDTASHGTVHSASREEKGLEVLFPTIYDGKWHSEDEAWQHYKQTGQHMGKFRTPAEADRFAIKYHNDAAAGKYD